MFIVSPEFYRYIVNAERAAALEQAIRSFEDWQQDMRASQEAILLRAERAA